MRRTQVMTVQCGWMGCQVSFEGTVEVSTGLLGEHRAEEHPDWVPWKRPRRKRTPTH